MRIVPLLAVLIGLVAAAPRSSLAAESPKFETALELFKARRYPEARPLFEQIVAADPRNAAAPHYLGRTIIARNDNAAFEEALPYLARAAGLEPDNAVYWGIYGGASLQFAARTNSLSSATQGREAMERALALNPDYLDAREGLYQFYQRAPWPIGSSSKAKAQLDEIRKRDPDLATVLDVVTKVKAQDFDAAFKMCEAVLAKHPDNYTALYHYGRTASISGQHLEAGLARLRHCLKLDPPTPASPTHSHAWQKIGSILEQLGQPAEAAAAYETALKLDPTNAQASAALARLR